jgi:hypothetical protein
MKIHEHCDRFVPSVCFSYRNLCDERMSIVTDGDDQEGRVKADPSATSGIDDRYWDALRDAGARLGRIESSLPTPKTTFEELFERAGELERRIERRKRRWWRFGL